MAVDYDPFCPVCGAPFSHVDVLDFSLLGEFERYLKETAYNMEILPLAQVFVSRWRFWSLLGAWTDADPGCLVHKLL